MKVLILAGGLGTRLSEETSTTPKPMLEIGEMPILWHIMKIYSHYGFHHFVILLGYKGYVIKEYFANYALHQSNVTIDFSSNSTEVHSNTTEPWKVTLLNTGRDTMTGGRILRARDFVGNNRFMLTYGDGVANIDVSKLIEYHARHRKAATMSAVKPEGRFGSINSQDDGRVARFVEKPVGESGWINGGFFVCEPKVFDYIQDDDATIFERGPLEGLARDGELYAYKHHGYWRCMDTLRDKVQLNHAWDTGQAQWKLWS